MMFMLPQPNDGFAWVQASAGPALVCRALEPIASHLFTTRGWSLGSRTAGDADDGWGQVAAALDVAAASLVRAHQMHGAAVLVRRAGQADASPDGSVSRSRPDADIIISNDSDVALAIQTADCVPLLLADRRTGVVAAAHAGWRGLAARVPSVAVDALAREFGSRPEDLVAAAGPAISASRYEVGIEVRGSFEHGGCSTAQLARWFSPAARSEHFYFDGWAAVRDQLESAGVPSGQIHVAALCTATYPALFCSHRRDGTPAGRMAAVVRARLTSSQPHPSPRSPVDPRAR
jgi:YfiH family protein